MRENEKMKPGARLVWAFPAVVLLVQLLPVVAALAAGLLLVVLAALLPKLRAAFLLFGFTALGHGLWLGFTQLLVFGGAKGAVAVVAGRLGLLGYLFLFAFWMRFAPTGQNYLHLGNARAVIQFPGIWRGKKEPIWRFTLIFCAICLVSMGALIFGGAFSFKLLEAGLLFALLNATLEEFLWRGFILQRVVEQLGPLPGVVVAALGFGVYHISLGFPLWACLLFAVGGFYMGGSAVVSKGLLAPWLMHLAVNLIFVFAGLIF